jgi:hypothetical protein
VVAEGVTRRSARDLGWLPEANGVEGYLELGITWLQNEVTALLAGGNPPIPLADSAATALETAFLLFTANSPSEIDTAQLIRGASPSTVTVTVLPKVDHAHGLAEAPKPDDGHGRLPLPNAAHRRHRVEGLHVVGRGPSKAWIM